MAIPTGTIIGGYEVLSLLGAGGMGEVYRARDTKLKREVALKVIPDAFAHDTERMVRFTREAELLAALNHVNIAAIYGIEEARDHRALILELIDGDTLANRIARGPVPAAEAIRIALQIAEALEAAHERNIIHRDLKPANIKINSQGVIKVLDFGLARALEDPLDPGNQSNSPTMSLVGTRAGIILGTAGYMAPEQARGKPADRRADIWAFGVVLFEMLSGGQAFAGETVSDTLAKVLEREPDWGRLPSGTPVALRRLVQRCLTKSVRDRLQAIGDARTALQEVLANPVAAAEPTATKSGGWLRLLPWALGPLLLAIGWLAKPTPPPAERAISRFEFALPAGQALVHEFRHPAEISPDGTRIAFVGQAVQGSTPPTAPSRLYVRSLDQWDATAVPGTDGATNPFFSPDGKWLGFATNPRSAGTELKKVALTGGAPVPLVKTGFVYGVTWGADGTIVYAERLGGLKLIREAGGDATAFTELDAHASEVSHRLPHFLPDGTAVLFTVLRYKDITPNWAQAQVWAKSLKTGQRKLIVENGVDARYAGNGWLVFARLGALWAVEFDPVTLSTHGSPVPVLDGVLQSAYTANALNTTGAAGFSLSNTGALLYAPGSIDPPPDSELVWVDRHGTPTPVGARPKVQLSPRLSPDETRILSSEYSVHADVWIYDRARGAETKHTSEGQNAFAIWSPDGSRIAFRSDRTGPARIYVQGVNSSDAVPVTDGPLDTPGSWTADKNELAFVRADLEGRSGIYVVSVDHPDQARRLLTSRSSEAYPEFSPNGRWLAYTSTVNDPQRPDVFVVPYPGPGQPIMVSTNGGTEPAWSREGSEIFYRSGSQMFAVRLQESGTKMVPGKPALLFDAAAFGTTANSRGYDVTRDGHFLMRRRVVESLDRRTKAIYPTTLRVILNWTDELRRNGGK